MVVSSARASREIPTPETEFMKEWMQALGDRDSKDAYTVEENRRIEDEVSKLDRKRARTVEYHAQDFVTSPEVQTMILTDIEKSILYCMAPVLRGRPDWRSLTVIWFRQKRVVYPLLFNWAKEFIVDIIQQGNMDLLPMKNIENLPSLVGEWTQ